MSSSVIRQFPDPVLRRVSEPIKKTDKTVPSLVKRLISVMRRQPGGVGIAAPQIGVLKRIAIIDISPKVSDKKLLILINPKIITFEKETVTREGCMSLPDYTANVSRAERIYVKWLDLDFKERELLTSGLEARCIQHEIDHLNGLLFVDRVSSLKRDVFPRKRYL